MISHKLNSIDDQTDDKFHIPNYLIVTLLLSLKISKSKCMVAGHSLFRAEPHRQLYNNISMENVDAFETLGVVMSNDGTADINLQKRINKGRQAYYG